jgi:hypothetical protein
MSLAEVLLRDLMLSRLAAALANQTSYIIKKQHCEETYCYVAITMVPNGMRIPGIITPTLRHIPIDVINEEWMEWLQEHTLVVRASTDRTAEVDIFVFLTSLSS